MINLTPDEMKAIEEMDCGVLRSAIDAARETRSPTPLTHLQLHRLGDYVRRSEHLFRRALDDLHKARSAEKVARTSQDALRAGWDLISAVEEMKERERREKSNGELFYIDDHIFEPSTFRPELTVTVSYRWRTVAEGEWTYGRITFRHRHVGWPEVGAYAARRKLTTRQREETLRAEWDHMRRLALFSVRDFFQIGGDGADIPETFPAVAERGSLNNHSLQFWRAKNG